MDMNEKINDERLSKKATEWTSTRREEKWKPQKIGRKESERQKFK